jgi:hypothetical protein
MVSLLVTFAHPQKSKKEDETMSPEKERKDAQMAKKGKVKREKILI